MHAHKHTYARTHANTHTHTHRNPRKRTQLALTNTYTHTHTHTYTHTHSLSHTHTYTHSHFLSFTNAHTHEHTHTHTLTHRHAYTNTHSHCQDTHTTPGVSTPLEMPFCSHRQTERQRGRQTDRPIDLQDRQLRRHMTRVAARARSFSHEHTRSARAPSVTRMYANTNKSPCTPAHMHTHAHAHTRIHNNRHVKNTHKKIQNTYTNIGILNLMLH